jgi:hypothetical protein
MNLKYYVLGTKSNPMLLSYLEKYYQKMLVYLQDIKNIWVLSPEIDTLLQKDNKSFISNPDISSLINVIYLEKILKKEQHLGDINSYIDILWKEISLFNSWNRENLSMNQWVKIQWTDIRLTPIDSNPFNLRDAHPDHKNTGWVLWWGEASEWEWLSVYQKTFEILKLADEWVYDELNQIIKKIVPLGTARWLHNSASYKECIGHLYMWFTIDSQKPEMNNLEAIIHESSHNKLNLIMHFDPLILNQIEEKFYSPYRPDARHIHGIYLWVHAITPTVYILLRSYSQWLFGNDEFWLEKAILFHFKNKIWMKVLKKYLQATELWLEILAEMEYVIWLSDDLIKKNSPSKELLVRAKQRQQDHFSQVNMRYNFLQY